MAHEWISVGVHLTPATEIEGEDYTRQGVHVAALRIGEVVLFVNDHEHGDAGIIAVVGAIRDAADDLMQAARERLRIAAGQQALPDALEPATFTEAAQDWAQSWVDEIAARPPFLPDIPLAAISESELRALDGNR